MDLEKFAETNMLWVEHFAPIYEPTAKKVSNDWIDNKFKNEIAKKRIVSKVDKVSN